MAVELLVFNLVAVWIGKKLDAWAGTDKPYITAFLVLFVTVGFLYLLYLDLSREDS